MDAYVKDFVHIIKNANYSNTYKMAWAKALVELSLEMDYNELPSETVIHLESIARKFIKYYYNHTIFFNLEQGNDPNRKPEVIKHVNELIEETYSIRNNKQPIRFEKVISFLKNTNTYEQVLKKTIRTLKADVSHRFLMLSGDIYDHLYAYSKGDDALSIKKENLEKLKDNATMLFDIINYRWSLILENMNSSPRIGKKVKIIDETNIRRKPLNKYFDLIELDNPSKTCFICGEPIEGKPALDHVIPWSYMYSDDIWNLVFVHQTCNSIKTNSIPDLSTIEKLEARNKRLIKKLAERKLTNKDYKELLLADKENLVRKFWIGCQ